MTFRSQTPVIPTEAKTTSGVSNAEPLFNPHEKQANQPAGQMQQF